MIKEPKQACPLIDKAIENFKCQEIEISSICASLKGCDALAELADNILHSFNCLDFIETLEELRSKCEDLREWGKHWESKAEKLEEELDELKEKLND